MNRLLQTLASDHCCVHRFVKEVVLILPVWLAAEHLGVTERTIYNYRRWYRAGILDICDKCATADTEDSAPPQ